MFVFGDSPHTAVVTLTRHTRLLFVFVTVVLLATQTVAADPGAIELLAETEFPDASTDELGYTNKGPSNP